jgi:hypothetical protein
LEIALEKSSEIPFIRSSIFYIQASGEAALHEFYKRIQPKNPEELIGREEYCHFGWIHLQLLLHFETRFGSGWQRHQSPY